MQRGALEAITALGGRVDIAQDSDAAIQKLRETYFDVVVTDLQLTPEKNNEGWDVLKCALKCSAETKVIITTVYSNAEVKSESVKRGAFSYISKLQDDLVDKTKAVVVDALQVA